MGRTPDHWKTSSPRPNGLMARPGTESSNASPSSAESAANFVFGREAWIGPRRRQGTIPTVSTSSGTDGSNPAPSSGESTANRCAPRGSNDHVTQIDPDAEPDPAFRYETTQNPPTWAVGVV